jgi:iron complex outermembrane recepter protein
MPPTARPSSRSCTTRLQAILEAPDGGNSLCRGGVNPFGRQSMSAECIAYLSVEGSQSTTFKQKISQAFVSGDLAKLPAGGLAAVAGVELRDFSYDFKPGSAAGPISGFNVQNPAQGTNSFTDVFGELQLPLLRRAPFARSMDLSFAARSSQSKFQDKTKNKQGDETRSNTFALNLTWEPVADIRTRASLQRSVRAPNFGELFDGGTSAPQYFDPCSASTVARSAGNAGYNTLCGTLDASAVGGVGATYQQTPGSQSQISLDGNPDLKPEKGTSLTLGLVFAPGNQSALRGFSTSVDYYQFTVDDAIIRPDANEVIADCYNFYGNNPTYSTTHQTCTGINRAGGDIFFIGRPGTTGGNFLFSNGGRIKTTGIDIAMGWAGNVGPGQLNLGVNYNHLLSYKLRSASFLPEKEYKGSVPYFGAGFGQAFPENRVVLTTGYKVGAWAMDARYRWFSAMGNRMSLNFPGEKFTGTQATGYLDVGTSFELFKALTLRVGLNNALDQQPRTYAPNVQSGTDPSSFDVIGRRVFVQAVAQFK